MSFNVNETAAAMLAVMKGEFTEGWEDVRNYAKSEAKKFAETGKLIVEGRLDGSINKQQARILVEMQKNSARAVLTAIVTISAIAAQAAINAAIGVLKTAVNTAVGFAIL